jgi:two-component system cell cycle response regulator
VARILVIEDNLGNLELMTYLLQAFGHQVSAEVDGVAGLAAARRERPDVIVCDVHLPGIDGYGVACELKGDADLKNVPLIAVTALAMVGDRDKVLAAGFDGYISKPIEPPRFIDQVEAFLAAGQRGVLPRIAQAPAAAAAAITQPSHATLLVVDDSPVNRELICSTLEPSGYRVLPTQSVTEALALLREEVPDLILSDLHMPGADGFNLLRAVKDDARLAQLPFVFITSSVWGEKDRDAAVALGVARFLLRPIEPQALLAEIAACLGRGAR